MQLLKPGSGSVGVAAGHAGGNTAVVPEKKTKAYLGFAIGVVVQMAATVLMKSEAWGTAGQVLFAIGWVLFCWGCMNLADAKGRSNQAPGSGSACSRWSRAVNGRRSPMN